MIHRKFYSILNVSWRMSSLALIIHRDRAPAWRDVSAALRILVLGTGYEGGPAGGPGGRGFHGPWDGSFHVRGDGLLLVRAPVAGR